MVAPVCLLALASLVSSSLARSLGGDIWRRGQDIVEEPSKYFVEALPPSQDPWYQVSPEIMADGKRGSIIKYRPAPGNLTSTLKYCVESTQIMFRTLNSQGEPFYAVTTVLTPEVVSAKILHVVSFQVPYESVNIDESPSYKLSLASTTIRLDIIDRMLDTGWFVSVPDHQGPNSAFTAVQLGAHIIIDSLEAITRLSSQHFDLQLNGPYITLWGYSTAALSTAMAHVMWEDYSDAYIWMELICVAFGGTPYALPQTWVQSSTGKWAGLVMNSIAGFMTEYPVTRSHIELNTKLQGPKNISVWQTIRTMTYDASMKYFAYHNVSEYFINGLAGLLDPRTFRLIASESSVFRDKEKYPPKRPKVYLYASAADEVSPVAWSEMMYRRYCSDYYNGMAVLFERWNTGNHIENMHAGTNAALEFIARTAKIITEEMEATSDYAHVRLDGWTFSSEIEGCEWRELSMVSDFTELEFYDDRNTKADLKKKKEEKGKKEKKTKKKKKVEEEEEEEEAEEKEEEEKAAEEEEEEEEEEEAAEKAEEEETARRRAEKERTRKEVENRQQEAELSDIEIDALAWANFP